MKRLLTNKATMFIMLLFFFKPICLQYFSKLQIIENIFVIGKIVVAFLVIIDTMFSMYPKAKINKILVIDIF